MAMARTSQLTTKVRISKGAAMSQVLGRPTDHPTRRTAYTATRAAIVRPAAVSTKKARSS